MALSSDGSRLVYSANDQLYFRALDQSEATPIRGTERGARSLEVRTLVWVDRQGKEEVLTAEPRAYFYPRISPDGNRLAVDVRDEEDDIWIWDFGRETLTRLTFGPNRESSPTWTPDGQRVAFSSDRDGSFNVYWKAADGTEELERLVPTEN